MNTIGWAEPDKAKYPGLKLHTHVTYTCQSTPSLYGRRLEREIFEKWGGQLTPQTRTIQAEERYFHPRRPTLGAYLLPQKRKRGVQ